MKSFLPFHIFILLSLSLYGQPGTEIKPREPASTKPLVSDKKIVVSNTNDFTTIRVNLPGREEKLQSAGEVKIIITGDIEDKYLTYKKTIRTDKNGSGESKLQAKMPGFITVSCKYDNTVIPDNVHILFVPNIYFRKGKVSKKKSKIIRNNSFDLKIQYLYRKISPRLHWWSRYPYGWGNDIEKHKGAYKGILIHHTAGKAKQTVREEELRLIKKFRRSKRRNGGREKKIFLDDLSYNFFINRKGEVKSGRTLYYRGGHAGRNAGLPKINDLNNDTISICFLGNYHNSTYVHKKKYYIWRKKKKYRRYKWTRVPIVKMTKKQGHVLKALITGIGYLYNMDLGKKYPDNKTIFKSIRDGGPAYWLDGHGTFKDKNCPGFDIVNWLKKERPSILKNIELLKKK